MFVGEEKKNNCVSAVFPLRASGGSAAAEERMQRGAGEHTGQRQGTRTLV